MSVAEQVQQIAKNPKPIYLILGQDNYWTDKIEQQFKSLIPAEQLTMNFASYDMEDVSLSTAIDDALSIPFFGERRLVFIKNPFFLSGERNKSKVKQNPDELLDYLKNLPDETVFVLFAPYKKLDGRKKASKALKKQAEVIDLNKITEQETTSFVREFIKEHRFTIDQDALAELVARTSGDLSSMMNELTKVFIYKNTDKNISINDVNQLVSKSIDQNIFDLVSYLMHGQTKKAIEFYHDLIIQNHEPIQINAILISQFRLVLQVKILGSQGLSQGTIASQLRVHPYRVKLAIQNSRSYSLCNLRDAYLNLADVEEKLKSTSNNPELLFEMFAIKLNDQQKKTSA